MGLAALLGPACAERDLALALIVARVAKPASKLATARWWADTTLGADFGVAQASTDDIYAAMDWLVGRQEPIEAALARRHLAPGRHGALRLVELVGGRVAVPIGGPGLSPGTVKRPRPRSSTGS